MMKNAKQPADENYKSTEKKTDTGFMQNFRKNRIVKLIDFLLDLIGF